MGVYMGNVTSDQIVAAFSELVDDNQIQTATDLLVSAEPDDQILVIRETEPLLLERFVQALDRDDRIEVIDQLIPEARQSLLQVLEEAARLSTVAVPESGTEDRGTAVQLIEEAIEEASERLSEPSVEEIPELPWRKDFSIVDGRLRRAAPGSATVTVYSSPISAAQRDLLESLGIDEHMLESALDPDEISRLEFDPDGPRAFIVMKRPHREVNGRPEVLEVTSLGIQLQADHLIIVSPDETPPVGDGDRADSLHDLLLRMMASTVSDFLIELKRVKRTSRDIQERLNRTLGNPEFVRMFSLSEGLVYHMNAIEANGRVLRRLRHLAQRFHFDDEELEYLDDIIIDNDQCSRQGEIFSTVLAGMLDARGNLINNNVNALLKNLTIINVVFLPLTLIASIGGMSEYSVALERHGIDFVVGYVAFSVAVLALGLALWFAVRGLVNAMGSR
jgi:magnesium transporter